MKIQVIKSTENELPQYETIESAGCDLRAELSLINTKFLFNVDVFHKTLEKTVYKIIKTVET